MRRRKIDFAWLIYCTVLNGTECEISRPILCDTGMLSRNADESFY